MNGGSGVHKQMANNFVKWWKAKFLNGYRQFTADGHENRISDTEELLGSGFSEKESLDRSRSFCCTTPLIDAKKFNNTSTPLAETESSQNNQTNKDHLNLEEFSCDVSLEGGINTKGQERQEFSFTLYDFDGYGKITKDDIAGLVTTIYEALGSSVKVPHYGSKTIRVKLTVSSDQKKHVSATVINQNDDNSSKNVDEDASRVKRDLNVTIKEQNKCKSKCKYEKKRQSLSSGAYATPSQQHPCCEHDFIGNVSDDSSDDFSHISCMTTDDEVEEYHAEESFSRCHKTRQRVYKKTHSSNLTKETTETAAASSKKQDSLKVRKQKRSSSLQRRELLEIIQANMEKNNFSLQTPRKHCNNNHVTEKSEIKHQRRTKNMPSLHYLAGIVDPEHFYVDLAAFQNATNLPQTPCQYNKLIDAVMCVSNRKVPVKKSNACKRNFRMRNYDLTTQATAFCQTLQSPTKELKTNKSVLDKISDVEAKNTKKNNKRMSEIVLGQASSLHHLRHRNRQEDQARAMAQVVRWLEQEFSSNSHAGDSKPNKNNSRSTSYEKYTSNSTAPINSTVHEHHHVHEHVHHHYHHYQETPIVV